MFYRAFELCYPQAKDLVRVHFPSVSFLRYLFTPQAHCACPMGRARAFFHGPPTLPTLELAPSFSSPPFKSILYVHFSEHLQAVRAWEMLVVRVPLVFALCPCAQPMQRKPFVGFGGYEPPGAHLVTVSCTGAKDTWGCFLKGRNNLTFVRLGWENRPVRMTTVARFPQAG